MKTFVSHSGCSTLLSGKGSLHCWRRALLSSYGTTSRQIGRTWIPTTTASICGWETVSYIHMFFLNRRIPLRQVDRALYFLWNESPRDGDWIANWIVHFCLVLVAPVQVERMCFSPSLVFSFGRKYKARSSWRRAAYAYSKRTYAQCRHLQSRTASLHKSKLGQPFATVEIYPTSRSLLQYQSGYPTFGFWCINNASVSPILTNYVHCPLCLVPTLIKWDILLRAVNLMVVVHIQHYLSIHFKSPDLLAFERRQENLLSRLQHLQGSVQTLRESVGLADSSTHQRNHVSEY